VDDVDPYRRDADALGGRHGAEGFERDQIEHNELDAATRRVTPVVPPLQWALRLRLA
jgi:hypothetical protein